MALHRAGGRGSGTLVLGLESPTAAAMQSAPESQDAVDSALSALLTLKDQKASKSAEVFP